MATQKFKSYLPIFPGFYSTVFESDESDEIYQYNQDNGTDKDYDDFEWDYEAWKTDNAKAAVLCIAEKLNELGFDLKIKYRSIYSPTEYNFENDCINVTYYFQSGCIKAVQKYIKANFAKWTEYIKDRFTSYDGFMSFYTNDADEWFKKVTITEMKRDFQVGGTVLDFILWNEKYEVYHLAQDVSEKDVYLSYTVKDFEFSDLSENAKQKAIKAYRELKKFGHYAPEIEVVEAMENETPELKYDSKGNCLNMPGLEIERPDPNQLDLFKDKDKDKDKN